MGDLVSKDKRGSPRKIDAAVAAIVAYDRAAWHLPETVNGQGVSHHDTGRLLTALLQRLDEPAARYAELDRYYTGKQPLAFLAPEAKAALGNRFGLMASNIPRLAVTALAERLRITGFTGDTDCGPTGSAMTSTRQSGVAHREALLLGDSYVIVWADQFGRPKVTVESAKQVAVLTDPGTRQITAAVKRWEDGNRHHRGRDVSAGSDRAVAGRPDRRAPHGIQHGRGVGQPARRGPGRQSAQHRPHPRRLGLLGDRRPQAAGRRAQQVVGRHDGHLANTLAGRGVGPPASN